MFSDGFKVVCAIAIHLHPNVPPALNGADEMKKPAVMMKATFVAVRVPDFRFLLAVDTKLFEY